MRKTENEDATKHEKDPTKYHTGDPETEYGLCPLDSTIPTVMGTFLLLCQASVSRGNLSFLILRGSRNFTCLLNKLPLYSLSLL